MPIFRKIEAKLKMLVAIANKIFSHFFPLQIVTRANDLDFTRRAVSRMLFTIKSSFHALSTCFEPLYTNMYLIGPSDGAMSPYALRLEIYAATFVYSANMVGRHGQNLHTLPI